MQKAEELVQELRGLGVKLWEEGGTLKLSAPKGAISAQLREKIAGAKLQILEAISQSSASDRETENTIHAVDRPIDIPLSFAQKRLWYLCQVEGKNSVTYNMPAALLFEGSVNEKNFLDSLAHIVQRHETLRTTFREKDGDVFQHIAPNQPANVTTIDLGHLVKEEQDVQVRKMIEEEALLPFDLSADALVRFTVARLADEKHVFMVTMHHIISDGWSVSLFVSELVQIYAALTAGNMHESMPALPVQYADFSIWQNKWLSGNRLSGLLAYWKQKLNDIPPLLDLPADRPRPPVQSFRGALEKYSFPANVAAGLNQLCLDNKVTPFMALISIYAIVLSRWVAREDIVIGSVIANRNRKEIEHLVGFFVNSLVFRINVDSDISFSKLLEQVRELSLEAFDHQDLPFEKLVEELNPERALSHSPVFQVAFALQNAGNDQLDLPELKVTNLDTHSNTAKYDLTFFAAEANDTIEGVVEYNTDIFDRATIRRFIDHFGNVLAYVTSQPQNKISGIEITNASEKELLLTHFCGHTDKTYVASSVLNLFKQKAEQWPDSIAVYDANTTLTYGELDLRSSLLAKRLIAIGISTREKTGVMAGRSVEQVTGMLAVMKAGACYVPLDPAYPAKRLEYIIADSGIRYVLSHTAYSDIAGNGDHEVILIDNAETEDIAPAVPGNDILPDVPAYMIYTSGSTGQPKGVVLAHGGLLNMVEQQIQIFNVKASGKVFQFASPCFDASVSEYFMALCSGACLVLAEKESISPTRQFCDLLKTEAITHITLPPSFLSVLSYTDLPQLETLIVAGEACNLDLAKKWAHSRNFFNAYGPTESTVCTSIAQVTSETEVITIGRPINNMAVYILDHNYNICPIGVPGELFIGGVGLAIEYFNRDELTAEKFVIIPSGDLSHKRLYRSGDRARFLANGDIEFLGRIDEQVKIRGFRIEPGEIEEALRRHPLICDAAVVVQGNTIDEKTLSAYVCPTKDWEQQLAAITGSSVENEQVTHWQKIFENSYDHDASEFSDATFNISGWNSSYTGQPLPAEEMEQWVANTVNRILEYRPQHVLEIGCGSGLLLFRIAPHCKEYIGSDFSANAIEYLEHVVAQQGLQNVSLFQADASEAGRHVHKQFDLIILNSVIQYFPDHNYLQTVIVNCMQLLTPGGHLFLGDVRHKSQNHLFNTSIEISKAGDELSAERLHQRISTRDEHEEELVLDPMFFCSLQNKIPDVTAVKQLLKKGRYSNELSKFRYDVVLQKNGNTPAPVVNRLKWTEGTSMDLISNVLAENGEKPLLLEGVPNMRLATDRKMYEVLHNSGSDTTADTIKSMARTGIAGLSPDDFTEPGLFNLFTAEVLCSLSDHLTFDVLFYPCSSLSQFYVTGEQTANTSPIGQYANNPVKARFLQKFAPVLKEFLAAQLPDYMVPSFFHVLDTLPVTPNGKTDRAALSKNAGNTANTRALYIAPGDEYEQELARLWQSLLRTGNISIKENFFDAGGHSLLAVQLINNINSTYNCNMTLVDLFTHSNIEQQAAFVRSKNADEQNSILLQFTTGTQPTPLFVIPGAGGNVLQASDFCRSFLQTTVYGLQIAGLSQDTFSLGIPGIAAEAVQQIRTIQPNGPYQLCGHSLGGWIAYEMACILKEQGESVSFIAMLDCIAPSSHQAPASEEWNDSDWLIEYAKLNDLKVDKQLHALPETERMNQLKLLLESANVIQQSAGTAIVDTLLMQLKSIIGMPYFPREISEDLSLHLFLAADDKKDQNTGEETCHGWENLSARVKVTRCEGDHFSMVKAQHGKQLADRIQKTIDHLSKNIRTIQYA